MTTVNVQVDNDIYECQRDRGGIAISAPTGRAFHVTLLDGAPARVLRYEQRRAWVEVSRSHFRLHTRLLQVARIAESKLAAHEAAATGE